MGSVWVGATITARDSNRLTIAAASEEEATTGSWKTVGYEAVEEGGTATDGTAMTAGAPKVSPCCDGVATTKSASHTAQWRAAATHLQPPVTAVVVPAGRVEAQLIPSTATTHGAVWVPAVSLISYLP